MDGSGKKQAMVAGRGQGTGSLKKEDLVQVKHGKKRKVKVLLAD